MRRIFRILLLAMATWAASLSPAPALEAQPPVSMDFKVHTLRESPREPADADLLGVLTIQPQEGWYTYAHDPGSLGQPTVAVASFEGSSRTLPVFYPRGVRKPDPFDPTQMVNMYMGETRLFLPMHSEELASRQLNVKLSMLLCSDVSCMPVTLEERFDLSDAQSPLPVRKAPFWDAFLDAQAPAPGAPEEAAATETDASAESATPSEWSFTPRFFQAELEVENIWKAALLALLAGFILNFMPCVLPVVSLKLSGLMAGLAANTPAERRRTFMEHNIFFALGIMVYFLVLSAILSAAGLAWGEMFQNPKIIMGLTGVVFALSLSLFGVYSLPVIDLKTPTSSGGSKSTAFFTGVLATLLATPCSGPFLGGVLAWALLQPPLIIAAIFVCIGTGMALPYLLMAMWPNLVRIFPRPGAWMVHLEKAVAFFLAGTCIYLLQILPETYLMRTLILLLVIGFGAWMWGAWTNLNQSARKRWGIRAAALALIVSAGFWAARPPAASATWLEFTPATFRAMKGEKRLLVDFTADWCVSCKFLEKVTLTEQNLVRWRKDYDLTYVQVDMTENDEQTMALLNALGSRSIPTVAILPRGAASDSPIVLRDLFTASTLEEALERTFSE